MESSGYLGTTNRESNKNGGPYLQHWVGSKLWKECGIPPLCQQRYSQYPENPKFYSNRKIKVHTPS